MNRRLKRFNIQDISTGKVYQWTISRILREVNRDHSKDWMSYNRRDWREGWDEWCEGDYYKLLGEVK
jgi:hypothetical protein